jgi:uncharacterized delta-60 repeat protein
MTLTPLANGGLLLTGNFTRLSGQNRPGLARLSATGALDAGFVPAAPWLAVPGALPQVDVVQPNGQLLVRWYDNGDRLVRLNANGTLDNTFSAGTGGGPGAGFTAYALPSGQVLVAGTFSTFNGQPSPGGLVRLNANGTLDNTFSAAATLDLLKYYNVVVQPDGRLLATYFRPTNNTTLVRRLNGNGTADASFPTVVVPSGTFVDEGLAGVMLQPQDGKILLYGRFTEVNGQRRMGLARLTNALLATRPAFAAAPELDVFPNPARLKATLRLDAASTTRLALVLDNLGRVVRRFDVAPRTTEAELDLSGLPTGLYVLRCGTATQKLVVE